MAAMSDTGSSFDHWAGLYDPEPTPSDAGGFADGTTAAAATSPTSAGSGGGSPTKAAAHQHQPGIEGPRVGKQPARRRSRASRRAPVTLLNTDTANFRAMVQQFTGIPAPPAGAFGAPVINFAADYGLFPPPAGVMSFDHLHHRSQQQHPTSTAAAALHDQLVIRRQQQQQQQYTGASFGYNGGLLHGAGAGDIFASAEDRMLLQSMQAAQMPPASAAINNTSLGFFA
ncbi:hypothetical protein PR202_gb28153 [Eleusine coracana subsp. coracana]|uniref:VQ domain-containing protein n=1 Tax=Eleusine coracana subsp. coracana TaxID=191504 RepID=A0AAV5FTP2_ELECO|nr:hypothetical protein QOZ80_6AG0547570 [Eleusine coracana subsp. coracana]GJN39059.1 hypothetical protein PR202_gb28153 [Eleusine coracana subsp. coracana]